MANSNVPKRGTPEHAHYMRTLGRKGGVATHTKHPEHLKDIAAAGGRASKPVKKPPEPEPPAAAAPVATPKPPTKPAPAHAALDSLDAIIAQVERG
jgi:hypothetical protein